MRTVLIHYRLRKYIQILKMIEWEGVLWLIALIYLFFINPYQTQHFTLCPFRNAGITFCPGCGLGRSIAFLYYGDIIASLKTHLLGIAAFILISLRITKLFFRTIHNLQSITEENYG